jgi:RNA polymerase sigma-B factor
VSSLHSTNYDDVSDMFRALSALETNSDAYLKQRDTIIRRCLPIADNIARRFRNRGEPIDDLVQVARVGLMNAVNRFDVNTGSDFLAFAVPTVMGEVRRHFRDHGWSLKVPRRLKDLNSQLTKATAELSQQLGAAPTATQVAKHLGLERDEVVEGLTASIAYSTLSTDAPARQDDERPTLAQSFGEIDSNLEKVLDVETVRPLIGALPKRQQAVLALRFFENMTQTQIAERLGISQMHVSRLLARSLATLRQQVMATEVRANAIAG